MPTCGKASLHPNRIKGRTASMAQVMGLNCASTLIQPGMAVSGTSAETMVNPAVSKARRRPVMVPQGDGSVLVKPGRPVSWVTPAEFARVMRTLGVRGDSLVVVYDGSGTNLSAPRAWWMFRVFGHDRVAVLDGGLATELDARGFNLADALWSARLLADAPEAIAAVPAMSLLSSEPTLRGLL